MKQKSKFLLLYEEVMKSIISVDTFKYEFKKDDNNNLTCTFETLNKNGNLVTVTVKILGDGKSEYSIINDNKTNILTEKQFMLNYYKDYEKFKKALKEFNEESNKKQGEDQVRQVKSFSVDGKEIPNVILFNEKLNKINNKSEEKSIKAGSDTFTFKFIDDKKIKNLIQVDFTLINNDYDEDNENELPKYNATAIIKLLKENSIIIKVILNDPDNKINSQELSSTEFQDKFNDVYDNLISALDSFEKSQD